MELPRFQDDDEMACKREKPEDIVLKLRQVEVLQGQSKSVQESVLERLKELEAENARLRRAVSELTLDKMILAEAARGNY